MHPIIRNGIAVIFGLVIGSTINMSILMVGGHFIPPPEGVDIMDAESIKAHIHLFEVKHFISPFLAHAIGTFAGAFLAAVLATAKKTYIAFGVACFFLIAGIINAMMIPAPLWFIVADIVLAYIPMGFLAATFNTKKH